ncbi:MAG: hypothetical protein IJD49_01325 [Clostridia bacterium]|nr:hypothetical protein [Clostridia bacterium]
MNGRLFMEAMGDIKDDFIMEAADIDEIRKIFSEWDNEEDDVTTEPEKTGHKKIKRIPKIRKLLIAAVISVSLLLAANFVAMAMGYDSLAILKEFGDRIIEMFEGEKTEFNGHTIVKTGEYKQYIDIKSFFENTDFEILYPAEMPDKIQINKIVIMNSYDEKYNVLENYNVISFVSNNQDNYSILVDTNPESDKFFLKHKDFSVQSIGDYQCYISNPESEIMCYFTWDNSLYKILAPTYDDIVTIVSNMKEYEE